MPRRPAPSRRPLRPAPKAATRGRWLIGAAVALVAILALVGPRLLPPGPETLRARAEAAEVSGDWRRALDAWRALNRTPAARGRTQLAEARAALALGLASEAEAALTRASLADPADPEPWRLRLDILRAEGRSVEASRVGWDAYRSVAPDARRPILRELTLALLLDLDDLDALPDEATRARLDRWSSADPGDVEALVARHRRDRALPRPGDPGLAAWVATLESTLARDPTSVPAREALVLALDESGDPDRSGPLLDAWPEAARDARYLRLRARRDLDTSHSPTQAAASLERVLAEFPHDWRSRALLARAYRALDRPADASREAALVALLRERLDPPALVPLLASALSRPDPAPLADLCARVGLDRLAEAWRLETK